MAAVRLGIPWEELLLDRTWPAFLFVLLLYAKVVNLVNTARAAADGTRASQVPLGIELAQQLATIVFVGLIVTLFVVRRAPLGPRSSPLGALVALGGTLALNLYIWAPRTASSTETFVASTLLTVTGTVVSAIGLATLGRCFGLFPEARGLVTRGPYRYVRHPVYLGEFLSGLGILLPVFSAVTLMVFLDFVALQLWRIANEERALEAVFPEYGLYRRRTWRLIPGVF
jgi:protein-S-isoprenylcysteine O-methyltransferase Ste14